MSRFARTSLVGALLAGSALVLLPSGLRPWGVAPVVLTWSALVIRGVVRLDSGFFCRATCRSSHATVRKVALTFDDGPDPAVTPRLLELLARHGASAAFFAIGHRVEQFPELARRCVSAGHLVENHSFGHELWSNFRFTRAMTKDLARCNRAIENATGVRPRYYRPPFGLSNHATSSAAAQAGLRIIGWQARGVDLRSARPERVVARILAGLEPGGIVLLHDGGRDPERVLAIAAGLLDGLAQRGLAIERLDRLLALEPEGRPASAAPTRAARPAARRSELP